MKRQISYDELKAFGVEVAKYLADKYPKGDYHLVAIARGGLTLGHIVAYNVAKPLNFYAPKNRELWFAESADPSYPLIFLEDLIAKRRTYNNVVEFMRWHGGSWEFIPVVIDASVEVPPHVSKYMVQTSDWLVFPHETFEAVKEGDWGLFREGTSENSKALT